MAPYMTNTNSTLIRKFWYLLAHKELIASLKSRQYIEPRCRIIVEINMVIRIILVAFLFIW